jgi:hypothetical protein
MKTSMLAIGAMVLVCMLVTPVCAKNDDSAREPWEKFGINAGIFLSATDTSVKIGSGIGLELDVERFLGLDTTNSVARVEALWRFSDNRRHRLDLSWFTFRRNGDRVITEDITIEDPDGNPIDIVAGTKVSSFFNLDIYELSYSYSFFQDDRTDLAVSAGAFIMPIDFGLKVTGLVDEEGTQKFTAPLPAFGLRMDFAITPKWFVRSHAKLFYLEYENFTGGLIEFKGAVEYVPWKHFGVGLGFDTFSMGLEAEGEDIPEIDLRGSVDFKYTGLQLYLRYFF